MRKEKRVWYRLLFAVYAVLMVMLLFNRNGGSEGPYWQQVRENLNIIPLYTIGNYWDILVRPEYYTAKWDSGAYAAQARHAVINLGGNVGMFLPLGILLPLVFASLRKW